MEEPAVEEPARVEQPPSAYERLWPLAVTLWFVIGYIQFNGLLLCLLYVLSLDECASGWPWRGALLMTFSVVIWFPISVLYVCRVKVLQAVADRQAREDGGVAAQQRRLMRVPAHAELRAQRVRLLQ